MAARSAEWSAPCSPRQGARRADRDRSRGVSRRRSEGTGRPAHRQNPRGLSRRRRGAARTGDPQAIRLRLEGGFEPEKPTRSLGSRRGPPVAGLGYAAIRDVAVSWLKHDEGSPARVKQAYAFVPPNADVSCAISSTSASTRTSRPMALDGVMAHVAERDGSS